MNIIIAGASGFIGQELIKALQKSNHQLTILGRHQERLQSIFPPSIHLIDWDNLYSLNAQDYDAVINLCGHNIAASRWNETIKKQIIDSRVKTSTALINWIIDKGAKPHLYNASAVGIYGNSQHDETYDEDSFVNFTHPDDFLSEVGVHWENALQSALTAGIPVSIMRFGVVLQQGEGMLKKLAPIFNFGLGSVMGSGEQIISWVHIEDVIRAILFLLQNPQLVGKFNITSPNPVTQAQFAKILAKAMHRPLLLKTPAFVVKAMFGEMGECLILKGQRVVPKRLMSEGYSFHYETLKSALEHEF